MNFITNLFKKSKNKETMPAGTDKNEDECNTSQKGFVLFDMENDISKDSVMLPTELNIDDTNENRENKPRLSIIKTFDPLLQTQYGNLNPLESVLEQERCALENDFLNHLKLDFLVDDKTVCGAETQDSSNVNIVQNVLHDIVDIVLNESNAESSDIIHTTTTTHTDINLNFSVEKEPASIVSNVSVPGSVNEDNHTSLVSDTIDNDSNIQDNTIIFNQHSSTFVESNELETSTSEHVPTTSELNETYKEPAVDHDETPAVVPVTPLKFNPLTVADDLSDSFLSSFNKHITISSPALKQTNIFNDSVKEPEVDETTSRLCDESSIVPCNVVDQPVDYLNVTTDISPASEHNFDSTYTNLNQTQDIPPRLDETAVLDDSLNSKTINLDATVNISSEVLTSVSSNTCSNSFNTTPAIVPTTLEIKPRMSEVNTELNSDLTEPSVASRLQVEPTTTCTNEMGDVINQSECFDKECDITNGPCDIKRLSVDNKQSFIKEKEDHTEMMERLAGVEAECEKYKLQVTDLKQELKVCRQKATALETELVELKLKANKSAASTSDSSDQNEAEVKALREREATVMKEANELKVLVAKLESKQTEMQKKEAKLSDDLNNKTQTEMQISRVMEEYEKSISSLVAENEKMKKERDTAQMHLANIELAFSDVHQKYERCKTIVQGFKDNEESLKQNIAMNEETILKQEQKYETLKSHAMAQLEKSNQELAMMKKQHEQEMARVTAQLKRYEIKNNSLMEALQQKSKECEQLSAVCDEFIGNV